MTEIHLSQASPLLFKLIPTYFTYYFDILPFLDSLMISTNTFVSLRDSAQFRYFILRAIYLPDILHVAVSEELGSIFKVFNMNERILTYTKCGASFYVIKLVKLLCFPEITLSKSLS